MRKEYFVCGDIGGTNTRFALYEIKISATQESASELVISKKYQNDEYKTFSEVLKDFLEHAAVGQIPAVACLAVAGPVKGNSVRFTNRESWSIDGDLLSEEFQIPVVKLVNDFLAAGYGLLTLNDEKDCIVLQRGLKNPTAPIACIGPGTGLGECFLTPTPTGYECFPTEGGHAEFAPRSDLEMELLVYLKHKFGQRNRISVERIVSGHGLANVYEFLSEKFPEKVDSSLHQKISDAGDLKAAVIATSTHNDLCRQTMDIFSAAYGSEAGVAGLKWLPYGGLYLTGGLTPKNIDLIRNPDGLFMHAFMDKGRVSGMLSTIPVFAVMVEDLGERGAQYLAAKLVKIYVSSAKEKIVPSGESFLPNSTFNSSMLFASLAIGVALGIAICKVR